MPIQCLKGLHGNYVRNCRAHTRRHWRGGCRKTRGDTSSSAQQGAQPRSGLIPKLSTQIRQTADPLPQNDRFSAFLPNGSALWRHPLKLTAGRRRHDGYAYDPHHCYAYSHRHGGPTAPGGMPSPNEQKTGDLVRIAPGYYLDTEAITTHPARTWPSIWRDCWPFSTGTRT